MAKPAEPITVNELQQEIADLSANHADYEAAHGTEDWLMYRVLFTIANNEISAANAVEMARLVIETSELDFPRYTA